MVGARRARLTRSDPGRAAHIRCMTENISTAATSARESSRQSDGKFGTQPAAEADLDLIPDGHDTGVSAEAAQAIKQVEAMGESGSDQIWYFTGGPSERLDDDEVNAVLAGNRDEAIDSIEENYGEYIYDSQREAAMKACDEADVDYDDLSWQDQQAVVDAVGEHSNPGEQLYKQLLSNTPSQLVRRRLDDQAMTPHGGLSGSRPVRRQGAGGRRRVRASRASERSEDRRLSRARGPATRAGRG